MLGGWGQGGGVQVGGRCGWFLLKIEGAGGDVDEELVPDAQGLG